MVVDSSALVAILMSEPDSPRLLEAILNSRTTPALSAVNYLESRVVIHSRLGGAGTSALTNLMDRCRIQVVAFDHDMAVAAEVVYRSYGKGYHRAALNMADCAAYALASSLGEPLLFKGNDFSQTPIPAVAY